MAVNIICDQSIAYRMKEKLNGTCQVKPDNKQANTDQLAEWTEYRKRLEKQFDNSKQVWYYSGDNFIGWKDNDCVCSMMINFEREFTYVVICAEPKIGFDGDTYRLFEKIISFKNLSELDVWLQTHTPETCLNKILGIIQPLMLKITNSLNELDLEFNLE